MIGYYASVRDGQRAGLLLGPYPLREIAEGMVDSAREAARKIDPDAVWYAYGTARHRADAPTWSARPMNATVTISRHGNVVHSETRRALNAGVRASEAAVREIARAVGVPYDGARPTREGAIYRREWTSLRGDQLFATVTGGGVMGDVPAEPTNSQD